VGVISARILRGTSIASSGVANSRLKELHRLAQ